MKFVSNVMIILVFINLTNSLPINDYYIEDFCHEFVSLSADHSNPVRLYLTRTKPMKFGKNYCMLSFNTSDNFYLEMEGQLGQLMLDKTRSDDNRLHFIFNSSITENLNIFQKIFSKKLIVIVENNEIKDINQSNDMLMETELEFRTVFKQEYNDCDESNEPCLNTEEELDESSGGRPVNYECPEGDCGGESFTDCEDYETNCTTNDPTKHTKRVENPITATDLHTSPVTSDSKHSGFSQLLFILCSLIWLRFR